MVISNYSILQGKLTISIVGYTLHFVFMDCYVKGWRELPTPKQPLNRGLMSVRSPKLTLTAIYLFLFFWLVSFWHAKCQRKKSQFFPRKTIIHYILGFASINDDGFETCAWIGNFMLRASNGFVCKKDFWKITGHDSMHSVEICTKIVSLFQISTNNIFLSHQYINLHYTQYQFVRNFL